jgi:hypothetical protein
MWTSVRIPGGGYSGLCLPSADSIFSVQEQILMLNDMELVQGDDSEMPPTDDDESVV